MGLSIDCEGCSFAQRLRGFRSDIFRRSTFARRIKMKARVWLSALALSAGFSTVAMAQVTGTVKLDGKAPENPKIDMSSVAQCAGQHKDAVTQETVVVGKDGGLANVVVSIKKDEGMNLPGDDKAPA